MIAVLNRRPGDAGDGAEIGVSLGVVVLKRRRLKTKQNGGQFAPEKMENGFFFFGRLRNRGNQKVGGSWRE